MIRSVATLALLLVATPASAADCRLWTFDELRISAALFIGTVTGYRLDDTTLVTAIPDCPADWTSDTQCKAFWSRVVTMQLRVDVPIHPLMPGQVTFETTVFPGFGCMPYHVGERWFMGGGYGYTEPMFQLAQPPTDRDIAFWRWIAN